MNQSSVYNILAFCFANKDMANEVAKEVRESKKLERYRIAAEAVVEVDAKGKTHVSEPGKGGRGATIGAAAGGVLALIGGPAGLLVWVVAGGVIGGVAGRYLGRAIPAKKLKALGEQMQPNSSAFLMIVEDVDAENVRNDMVGFEANVITLTMDDDMSNQIAAAVAANVDLNAEEG
jgi:uncharacterized membrane protein